MFYLNMLSHFHSVPFPLDSFIFLVYIIKFINLIMSMMIYDDGLSENRAFVVPPCSGQPRKIGRAVYRQRR